MGRANHNRTKEQAGKKKTIERQALSLSQDNSVKLKLSPRSQQDTRLTTEKQARQAPSLGSQIDNNIRLKLTWLTTENNSRWKVLLSVEPQLNQQGVFLGPPGMKGEK